MRKKENVGNGNSISNEIDELFDFDIESVLVFSIGFMINETWDLLRAMRENFGGKLKVVWLMIASQIEGWLESIYNFQSEIFKSLDNV
jgi:hypothetical protein